MKLTVGAPVALTAVSVPVSIAVYPPSVIPVAVIAVIVTAIVVWHLARGGRAIVRRSPKGYLTFTLDSARKTKG